MKNKRILFTDRQLVNCQTYIHRHSVDFFHLIPRIRKENETYSIRLSIEYLEDLGDSFKKRIFEVSSGNLKANLTFGNFLDMLPELSIEEHQQITEKVMEESDVDGEGKLSYIEFEHCITRALDFLSTFHTQI
ncbi:hypothetical protein ABEB36_011147 [Hypothenemus hampei]|uniref:EF-hand domain-containing protein n=1 Tax=Hypothenemus hampei TaxID=57062 RepID=A0ABD1EEY0_HYPHA